MENQRDVQNLVIEVDLFLGKAVFPQLGPVIAKDDDQRLVENTELFQP